MRTRVTYEFGGPAGNSPGIRIGADLGSREYEGAAFVPVKGDEVMLSYGPALEQSAIFSVTSVLPDLSKAGIDIFHVHVSLR